MGFKINIGPGGTAGLGYEKAIPLLNDLSLTALEIEFGHGVNMSDEKAEKIGDLAKKNNISLSVHAPYFVNLASTEKYKIEASKKRILDACRKANILGAKNIVFHAAFYGKRDKDEVFDMVKTAILEMQDIVKEKKWDVVLCPEAMGKVSQFGTVDELVELSKETGCGVCIDFAHIYARNQGKIDFDKVCEKIKNIKHLHAHFSGIEYTEKGEKRHILTPKKMARELLTSLTKHKISLNLINESPDPINDAKMMNDILEKLMK